MKEEITKETAQKILEIVGNEYDDHKTCGYEIECILTSKPLVEAINRQIASAVEAREREISEVERVLERHTSWKPTEGHGSEEELGFQKGLMAEAKLIKKEILSFLGNDHKCGGDLCIVCGYKEKLSKS